jgi:hypothetical protein
MKLIFLTILVAFGSFSCKKNEIDTHTNSVGAPVQNILTHEAVFDSDSYLPVNPDLGAAGVVSPQQALEHWLAFGAEEGRQAHPLFYSRDYLELNADVTNAVGRNNHKAAIEHYVRSGLTEGRVAQKSAIFNPLVFNPTFYLQNNRDLAQNGVRTSAQAARHWRDIGAQEGRQAHPQFHSQAYRSRYPEVQQAYGNDMLKVIEHYLAYGHAEGRGGTGAPAVGQAPAAGNSRIGLIYGIWHAHATTAMSQLEAKGIQPLTIEDVIRGNGKYSFNDVLQKHFDSNFLNLTAAHFYYHNKPAIGFYCIYKRRATEQTNGVQDCPNIERTLETHAKQILGAGIDHIILDNTNLHTLTAHGDHSDTIQLRPTEIIFEEWRKLRDKGIQTPQITIWQALAEGANHQIHLMNHIYNNPRYDDLIVKDKQGRKVFYYVDGAHMRASAKALADIRNIMGPRIALVPKWAITDAAEFNKGKFTGLSWCLEGNQNHTSVLDRPCNRPYTPSSEIGSGMMVSTGFHVNYSSIPFQASGKLRGLTFRKQWESAFAVHPEWIILNAWNENAAQPQNSEFTSSPFHKAMGMESDSSRSVKYPDATYAWQWVDQYGAEFGRDIEPTQEHGDFYYRLTQSCIRVLRSGARSCNKTNELCCTTPAEDQFQTIYSLVTATSDGGRQFVTTPSEAEKMTLQGQNWREVCTPFPGPIHLCVNINEPLASSGAFVIFKNSDGKTPQQSQRRPLYRCFNGSNNYMSLDATCETGTAPQSVLGYISTVKTSETPRHLHRCIGKGGHFHSTYGGCAAGTFEYTLGFVK